jgi:poly(3-hydroxybutyrate) depolymerase
MHRGRLVKPESIKTVALMTVEGENDDISGIGQTQAAHELCSNIPGSMKIDYIQPGVGHYGVFSGTRYRTEIQPRMREFFLSYFDREKETQFQLANAHLIHSA